MLKDEIQNKMIDGKEKNVKNKSIKENGATKEAYFFPDHGVTVFASSQEEAHEELQAIIKKK